jgi:hypothetical protein
MEQLLLSKKQAVELMGGQISMAFLNKAIGDGRLRVVRCGRRVFFERQYLLARIQSGQLLEPTRPPAGL